MLVGASYFDVLKWVGLLAAAVLAIAFRVTPKGTPVRVSLSLLGGVGLALFLAFGLRGLGREAVVVKIEDPSSVEKTRAVLFGERGYVFQNGHTARLGAGPGALVVNDSERVLSLETRSYGSIASSSTPTAIPPMSTADAPYGVDFVGPDDAPPSEVSSSIGFAMKYWLRW